VAGVCRNTIASEHLTFSDRYPMSPEPVMEMVKDPKWVSPFSSEKILATLSCRLEPSSPLAVDEEDMETRPEERDNFLLLLDRR
jgi:hypothetical protein